MKCSPHFLSASLSGSTLSLYVGSHRLTTTHTLSSPLSSSSAVSVACVVQVSFCSHLFSPPSLSSTSLSACPHTHSSSRPPLSPAFSSFSSPLALSRLSPPPPPLQLLCFKWLCPQRVRRLALVIHNAQRVHAVSLIALCEPLAVEHVAQVAATTSAQNLRAHVTERRVCAWCGVCLNSFVVCCC